MAICYFHLTAQNPGGMPDAIFPLGNKIEGGNFTGSVWVQPLVTADSAFNSQIGNVVFEPKARSKWHRHPGGQILLALAGVGYYQEKGKELQILRKGDVAKCPPDVEHWHGASHDSWFVQVAITPEHPKGRVIWLHEVSEEEYVTGLSSKPKIQRNSSDLEIRHQHIVTISAFTVKGDLEQLKNALDEGLNAGLTVNEIREVLVHLYAYCGFPRSIQGLNTFMSVLEARKTRGITDEMGKSATPITDTLSKYDRGKKVLEALTGQPQVTPPKSGYGAFSPETDVFLKEHLFADIFGRDVLSYQDREIVTITALINLGGVEPMLKGHFGIALNIGITESQLKNLLSIIESAVGTKEADEGRKVLSDIKKYQAKAPPTQPFGKEAFGPSEGTMLRWLGMAGFLINSRGTTFMIDPLLGGFDMPVMIDFPIAAQNVPRLDAILVTHSDNDHYSVPTCLALKSVTRAFHSTVYVDSLMKNQGLPSFGHGIGASFDIGKIRVRMTAADHSWQNAYPGTSNRYFKNEDCTGFWIETPDGNIWATGDSRLMDEHLHMGTPDAILFDFSDSEWHFTFEGAVKLANAYPNTPLLLHHWGSVDAPDFPPFNGDPQRLLSHVVHPERVHILAPGEPFTLKRLKKN